MMLFRLLIGGLLIAALLSTAISFVSPDPRWRLWGGLLLKWALGAVLALLAIFLLERLPMLL